MTVNVALPASYTWPEGPDTLSSAASSSLRVIAAGLTFRPVAEPGTVMVSSPSTVESSIGVMVIVPEPVFELAGMVMVASRVAE